jgi:hypothetical protein
MPEVITVDRRFNGPPDSANGGYVCGLIAGAIREAVSVRLQKPSPLDTPLVVKQEAPGEWRVLHDGQVVATAAPAKVEIVPPPSPGYVAALAIARHYPGFKHHDVPTCFVCGPQRSPGDGLRIFPGPVAGAGIVAAPWLPDISLMDPDGKIKPEFIWAALDCPGYYASIPNDRPAMLGDLAVHIDRRVPADEPCVVVGWPISSEGRKHKVGTALYAEDGGPCARGLATWIEQA